MEHAKLSVVVCTRNRAKYLQTTLTYYEKIETDLPWELILVDNGSTDATPIVLREFCSRTNIRVRVVVESRAGLSRARNAGLRSATGEIIAFTDDDCYPQPDFVEQTYKIFATPEINYVGGRILLYDSSDYPITIQQRDSHLVIEPRSLVEVGLINGANMSVRKSVFESVGEFDELLGAGAPIPSGEDLEFISRASAAGFVGVYDPRPLVLHHHRRKTKKEVSTLKRSYDLGRGAYFIKCALDPKRRRLSVKVWYWSVRSRIAYSFRKPSCAWSVIYELQGAVEYLIKRTIGKIGGFGSNRN